MITAEQNALLTIAQRVIRDRRESQEYLPCFGLLSDSSGQTHEFVPGCVPGEEAQAFAVIVENLKNGILDGADCTALAILLEQSPDDSESGATIDLEQRGEQRVICFMPFSCAGTSVTFQQAQFTAKASVLFRAP